MHDVDYGDDDITRMYTQHIHTPWWVVVRVSAYWLKDSMKEDHSKRKKNYV